MKVVAAKTVAISGLGGAKYTVTNKFQILEGGNATGKTTYLREQLQAALDEGKNAYYINASLPLAEWFKQTRVIHTRNANAKIHYILNTLPDEFYVYIDNADNIANSSGNKKFIVIDTLMQKATGGVISCSNFSSLPPPLKARLKGAERVYTGSGNLGFDMTYIFLAVIIIVVVMMGQHNLIFIAAAMRYMFQGMRMGGRA